MEVTRKKEELQKEVEELWVNLLTNADLETLMEEMWVSTQKAKKLDFHYHWMVEFKTL
jgi:hypothetical protein